ncbi:MAG: hypothetical protein QOH82_274, partial [Mycobacterium sp.]|nr:hypothetical protein [Mycobacterium sp.]
MSFSTQRTTSPVTPCAESSLRTCSDMGWLLEGAGEGLRLHTSDRA